MLQDRAMLIRLSLSTFNPYKRDRHIVEAGAVSLGTDSSFYNATKRLVPKSAYSAIQKSDSAIRQFVYHNTRPWFDEGWRILPTASYFEFVDGINNLFDKRDKAVQEFAEHWPQYKEQAKQALNGEYNEADFPEDVANRFSHDLVFMPIPRSGDFRADGIDSNDLAKIEQDTLKRIQDQFASGDLWQRVHETVQHISERLHSYGTDSEGKVVNRFHDTLINNLRDLVAILPKLNIAQDENLDAMHKRLEQELCSYDPQILRDNSFIREDVATKADKILADVSAFMA